MAIGHLASAMTVLTDSPGTRTVPFGSNSLQHGTAVFEGIRCYRMPGGSAVFRLDDHLRRLLASASALGIAHDYSLGRLRGEILRAARRSELADAYIRPVLYTPEPRLGVGLRAFRFTLGIEIWPAEDESVGDDRGARLTVSPWPRIGRSQFPVGVKATGLYALAALASTRAVAEGFDDALLIDPDSGRVAEATIANVFLVRDGTVRTPWLQDSLLPGITRDCVLTLARQLGYEAVEGPVSRTDLVAADEVFLTGTAIGLRPVIALDQHAYPPHRPIFDALERAYNAVTRGNAPAPAGWLTSVSGQVVSSTPL
jgi:branched-chain amino acid aminotransferase